MPDSARLPKYRYYKPKNLAVVRIDGRDIYLGRHDSPESREKYLRVLAEWMSSGIVTPAAPHAAGAEAADAAHALTISQIVLAFWRHAETYYRRPDGRPSAELDNFRRTLRPLHQLDGSSLARDFGPKSLKAVRQTMIDSGMCRKTGGVWR